MARPIFGGIFFFTLSAQIERKNEGGKNYRRSWEMGYILDECNIQDILEIPRISFRLPQKMADIPMKQRGVANVTACYNVTVQLRKHRRKKRPLRVA